MPYHTLVESDGKTVYILSGKTFGGRMEVVWHYAGLVMTLGLFAFVLWELAHERSGLLLCFLLTRFAGYPVLRRMSRGLVREEIQLDTQRLTTRRTYGFIRGRQRIATYHEGQLSTGAEEINKTGSLLQVSWYTDTPGTRKPQLLYRHFFPMAGTDYEAVKTYLQELFDLDASDHFGLLFSAN